MKRCFLLSLGVFGVAVPSLAFAAEETEGTAEPRHGVDVIATVGAGSTFGKTASPMLDLELSGYWKVSPRVALGLATARTWLSVSRLESSPAEGEAVPTSSDSSDTNVWRLAPAARWDYHRGAWTRGWIGGQCGLAFIVDHVARSTLTVPSRYLGQSDETRVAPVVVVDAGFAFQPVDWVSVGLSMNAFHLAAGTIDARGSAVRGPFDGMFAGLVVGVHVPMGPRAPR